MFQTKLFPIPRVQREWHRLWADEDVEEVKGNWRDELKDGASVEAQRDDDTWVMTRIESVAADVLGLAILRNFVVRDNIGHGRSHCRVHSQGCGIIASGLFFIKCIFNQGFNVREQRVFRICGRRGGCLRHDGAGRCVN